MRKTDGGTGVSINQSEAGRGTAGATPTAPPQVGRVVSGMRLHYQITGTPQLDAAADLFVLDLFDTEAEDLAALHARGRVAIAYLSAGSHEPWRPDADDFPEQAIGSRLASYPNESWLDIRAASVRALMHKRLQLARNKGFDGIYPGSLDAYRSQSGFTLSESDQLDYDRFLASEARALGLSPGLSGDFMLGAQLIDAFDWAIAFGCFAADSCERLTPWAERNKPVFDLELEGELSTLCPMADALGFSLVLKQPGFDAWSRSCP
ncbi:MAG TPA: endo alpha-1,4 polygalactosaminidase [Polyangiales bacterium]|nr:endo alpha-1,4 polygalactosaminidase [Polyangiales bacterium]